MTLFQLVTGALAGLALFTVAVDAADGPSRVSKPTPALSTECLVYVGTYTGGASKGIYAYRMNLQTGTLTNIGLVAETPSPSFLEIDPKRRVLYAVNETERFGSEGAISAFSMNPQTGMLTLLAERSAMGSSPCHLTLDQDARHLLSANYGNGSITVFPVESDGKAGPPVASRQHVGKSVNPERQEGPHAHCVTFDPSGRFLFVCDLGLDHVMVYRYNPNTGSLSPGDPPFAPVKAGAGPRHMAFHPNGRFAYVLNELDSTITIFAWDPRPAALHEIETLSTLPNGFSGANTAAEIEVHPSGNFLYASNRGHDSIAIFSVDSTTGKLTLHGGVRSGGKKPRHFALSPGGNFLLAANQDSNSIVVFRVGPEDGALQNTGQTVEVPAPVCVKFFQQ